MSAQGVEITAALPLTKRVTLAILSQHQELKSGSIAHGTHLGVRKANSALSVFDVVLRTNCLAIRPLFSKGFIDYDLILFA